MALLLFAIDLALNGRADGDVLITGCVIVALVMLFACKFGGWSLKRELAVYRLIPGAVVYLMCLMAEIFKANWEVIRVITRGRPDPYVRTFQTTLKTSFGRAALANSITLTPGTVTVQQVGDRLTVHCLTKEMADALKDSALEKRLKRMEEKLDGKRV